MAGKGKLGRDVFLMSNPDFKKLAQLTEGHNDNSPVQAALNFADKKCPDRNNPRHQTAFDGFLEGIQWASEHISAEPKSVDQVHAEWKEKQSG